jgi:tetratricopeptide (TPR) repeat protein
LQISRKELLLKEYVLIGNEHYYENEYEHAIDYYEKALQIDPDNAYVLFSKGEALGKLGKYEEAIKYYDKALEINPKNGDASYNEGEAFDSVFC